MSDAPALQVVSAGASAVELRWTLVSDAVNYDLRTWWPGRTDWQRIDDGSLTGASFIHPHLTTGRKYFYIVAGVDGNGNRGPWSDQVAVTVPESNAPTPTPTPTPTLSSASTPTPTPTLLLTSTPTATLLLTATPTSTQLVTSTPTATPTPTATAAAQTAPVLIAPVVQAEAGAGRITLTWSAVAHAVGYDVRTWYEGLTGWQRIDDGSLTATSFIHPNLTPGRTYHYIVAGLDGSGELGPWSQSVSAVASATVSATGTPTPTLLLTATSTPTPTTTQLVTSTPTATPTPTATAAAQTAPALIAPVVQAVAGPGRITLTWGAVANAVGYDVRTWWTGAGGWQRIDDGSLTATSFIHPNLTPGRTYHYIVAGLDSNGVYGPWSRSASATVSAAGTPTPTATPTLTATVTVTPTITPTPTPATTDRGALIALYEATDGDNWTHNDNWLSDKPLSDWDGVTTDSSGRVTVLILGRKRLRGSIPDLSALTELRTLALGENRLSGEIPDLSALIKLEWLGLSNNQLSGPIPDLSALTKLEWLDLGYNQLSGPVPDLSALTKLEWLDLWNNQLSGPIPDLSALTKLEHLDLSVNRLSGLFPDLSALTELERLVLSHNRLSGSIPDLSALTELERLVLSLNQLSGPIPELSALTKLEHLALSNNQLSGEIPELSALSRLTWLALSNNQLSGPIPDLSALSRLTYLYLASNQLSGPIPDLSALTSLTLLYLSHNQLSGPIPDLSALTSLRSLFLTGNRLCLPAGVSLSHSNSSVDANLKSLNPAACTEAELAAFPAAPQNLTATVGAGQVTLTWDAVANAASYELRAWDSIDRRWDAVGGLLTSTTYSHPVLTDGRNYYFQIRARDANGVRGPWAQRVQAIIVPQQFPPPPPSLGLDIFYQKYLEVAGVVVTAPSEVSDGKMAQAREIVAAMFSGKPDLFETTLSKYLRIAIYKLQEEQGYVSQLPEFRHIYPDLTGTAMRTSSGWVAGVRDQDKHCYAFIHEFAHAINFALEDQPGGHEFRLRLGSLYSAALRAGLWKDTYASTNTLEYWAETVTFWFQEFMRQPSELKGSKLEDYDPEIAKLIAETFGDATVPAYCKP